MPHRATIKTHQQTMHFAVTLTVTPSALYRYVHNGLLHSGVLLQALLHEQLMRWEFHCSLLVERGDGTAGDGRDKCRDSGCALIMVPHGDWTRPLAMLFPACRCRKNAGKFCDSLRLNSRNESETEAQAVSAAADADALGDWLMSHVPHFSKLASTSDTAWSGAYCILQGAACCCSLDCTNSTAACTFVANPAVAVPMRKFSGTVSRALSPHPAGVVSSVTESQLPAALWPLLLQVATAGHGQSTDALLRLLQVIFCAHCLSSRIKQRFSAQAQQFTKICTMSDASAQRQRSPFSHFAGQPVRNGSRR